MMTSIHARGRQHGEPNGFILPAVLLATVVLTLGASTALMLAMDERTAAGAVLDSGAARFAAEAGIALALKDFAIDSVAGTLAPGEKYEFDWWYHPDISSFRPILLRCDDGTGEPIYALTVEGRSSQQVAGATSNVRLMLAGGGGGGGGGGGSALGLPTGALVVEGPIRVMGEVVLSGACADLHTNSDMKIGATLRTEGVVSASGTVGSDQLMLSAEGEIVSPESSAPLRNIPTLDPSSFCGEADFFLRGGWVIEAATGDSISASSGVAYGWEHVTGEGYKAVSKLSAGTVCADQSVEVNAVGVPGNPLELTILTRGSIKFGGDAYVVAAHTSGVAALAAGDLALSGQITEVVGLLYAGSQCLVGGTTSITGQLICRGQANPGGSREWAAFNDVSGRLSITYVCPASDQLEPISTRTTGEVW